MVLQASTWIETNTFRWTTYKQRSTPAPGDNVTYQ